MAFKLFELSNRSGRPVFLYELRWGDTYWRYTSADRDVTWGPDDEIWSAVAISDNGVVIGAQPSDFIVSIPRDLPIVTLFRGTPPAGPVWLTCRKFHWDDPDAAPAVYWVGTVGNIKPVSRAEATLVGLSIGGTMRRTGLRLPWSISCPHILYDGGCRADKNAFKNITTITAINATNRTISVAGVGAFPAARYAGGFFEWAASVEGTLDRRGIESSLGGTSFKVFGRTDRLTVGMAVTMYLGCDLTAATCEEIFDNLPNHGGMEFMALNSPFDGKPVF